MSGQIKPDNLGIYQAPAGLPGAFCAITQSVFEDEACLFLSERNLRSEDGKGKYRYQVLRVIRNDRPANAYICLGPSSDFQTDELDIPGAIAEDDGKYLLIHTVAELREIAEYLRMEPVGLRQEAPPMQQMWLDQVEEKEKFKDRVSTFGHGGQLVRQ